MVAAARRETSTASGKPPEFIADSGYWNGEGSSTGGERDDRKAHPRRAGRGALREGRVSHVGHHPVLEEQLLGFTGALGERSPDRLDAATWAITDLMGYGASQ